MWNASIKCKNISLLCIEMGAFFCIPRQFTLITTATKVAHGHLTALCLVSLIFLFGHRIHIHSVRNRYTFKYLFRMIIHWYGLLSLTFVYLRAWTTLKICLIFVCICTWTTEYYAMCRRRLKKLGSRSNELWKLHNFPSITHQYDTMMNNAHLHSGLRWQNWHTQSNE